MGLFGLYRARRTPLHLAPAWVKVLGLVAAGVWLAWCTEPAWSLTSMAVAIALLVSTLPPPGATLRGVAPVLAIVALTGAYQVWQGDTRLAVDLSADFVSLVCLALALTTSTPLDASMGLVSRAARPLRRWIPPEALALVFSLTLRAIPELTRILGESRDAARARGLNRSPRAMLVPTGVRAVGYALDVGDAITARGLADEATGARRESRATA